MKVNDNFGIDSRSVLKSFKLNFYVKNIFILENKDSTKKSKLPFFPNGYPGIMFHQCENEVVLHPKNKRLSEFFLYGQILHPIELSINGAYRLIVFQLFPFAAKILFGGNQKELNDACYDLSSLESIDTTTITKQLVKQLSITKQVQILAEFICNLLQQTIIDPDQKIPLAINLILSSNGKISVQALRENLQMTERTLQRQFIEYVGISPKQFSKIIQFQSSVNQLSKEQHSKLTDIVYENGYSDQSHFIRDFKRYTGKKPSKFKTPNYQPV